MKINQTQFSLRTLFLFVLGSAVLIVICQLCATALPELLILSFIIAITMFVVGFGLLSTAAIFAVSVMATHRIDENMESNLEKCGRMAGMGLVAMIPMVLLAVVIPVLSVLIN